MFHLLLCVLDLPANNLNNNNNKSIKNKNSLIKNY